MQKMEKEKGPEKIEPKPKIGDYVTASLAYNEQGEFTGDYGEGRQGIFVRDNKDGTILIQGEEELYLCMATDQNSIVPDKGLSPSTSRFVNMIRLRMHRGKYVFPNDTPGTTRLDEKDKQKAEIYRKLIIDDLPNASLREVIHSALPIIEEKSPGLLGKHKINLSDLEEQLRKAYPDEPAFESALYAFKVQFFHVAYFLINRYEDEISESLDTLKEILAGAWEDPMVKNKDRDIFFITRNPFPTAIQIAEDLKRRVHEQAHMRKYLKSKMGFLKEPELNRLLIKIHAASDNPDRAAKIIETEAGGYFNELRGLCADENLPIPDYYVPEMKGYIKELRKRILA